MMPKSYLGESPTREKDVSRSVKTLLTLMGLDWFSTESGYLAVGDDQHGWRPRPGGTRTTPGIPDLLCYGWWEMPEEVAEVVPGGSPRPLMLTVEVKGKTTPIKPEQWEFNDQRAERGEFHLIVRSADALVYGLRYLGIAPSKLASIRMPWLTEQLPENANYLEEMRLQAFANAGWFQALPASLLAITIPANHKRRP